MTWAEQGVAEPGAVEVPTIRGEMMLLRWSESSSGGASVTFQLADVADLEPFKAMTIGKGSKAGQRFMSVLALLGDDETPQPAPSLKPAAGGSALQKTPATDYKGGQLSRLVSRVGVIRPPGVGIFRPVGGGAEVRLEALF